MVDGLPVFNPQVRTIEDFKTVITRDKGSPGDADGRKKLIANKELAYVYWMCHYSSEFLRTIRDEKERHEIVKSKVGLEEKWKPDAVVKRAMTTFLEMTRLPSRILLEETRETVYSAQDMVRLIGKKMRAGIQKVTDNEDIITESPQEVDKIFTDFNRLNGLIKEFPTMIDNLIKLEEKVKKEEEEGRGKGGRKINKFQL